MTGPVTKWHAPRGTTMYAAGNGEYVHATDYARLEQECEQIKKSRDWLQWESDQLEIQRNAALKQVEGLREDAERYQKLRKVGGMAFSDAKTGERAINGTYDHCVDALQASPCAPTK